MIDGQSDRDGLFADPLIADLAEPLIGAEVESSATLGDRQDVGAESVTAFGLTEEARFPPDDIRSEGAFRVVVRQVQTGEREAGPEPGFLRQPGLTGVPGPLTRVRLLAWLESQAKVVTGSVPASSIMRGTIPALSPSMFELKDEASALDEPEAPFSGLPLASGKAFQVANHLRPTPLALGQRMTAIGAMAAGDQHSGAVVEQLPNLWQRIDDDLAATGAAGLGDIALDVVHLGFRNELSGVSDMAFLSASPLARGLP